MTAATEEDPAASVRRTVRSAPRASPGTLLRETRAEPVRLARLARRRLPTPSPSPEPLV